MLETGAFEQVRGDVDQLSVHAGLPVHDLRCRVLMVVATAVNTRNWRSPGDDRREKDVSVPRETLTRLSD
jgi:hypothetical protein